MEVRNVEIIPVAHREPPLRNSWGVHSEVEARTIIRVETADGAVGISETYGNSAIIETLESAASFVEGIDPYEMRPLSLRLQQGRGRGDASAQAYGAFETALLDLIGKSVGEPMHKLLGGKIRDEVEYSAYLFFKHADPDPENASLVPQEVMSPEAMVEEAKAFVDAHGFETLKLKGGVLEPDEEIRTLELLADEFGSSVPLRIDPNGVWSVETATRIARELESSELNVEFLEDPVPTMNAHKRLKENTTLPVATNMYVTSFEDIAPAVDLDAVDIILSDHHYWGGPRKNVDLDTVARTLDLGVGMHSNSHLGVSMAAMTQVAATMPTLQYACDTHYPWESEDLIDSGQIEISEGTIDVSDEPGLGVSLDETVLERMHERYEEHEPERDDATALLEQNEDWIPNKPAW